MENAALKNAPNKVLNLHSIKIIGITVETDTKTEMEGINSKIDKLVNSYFTENIPEQIENRNAPGVTYCAYTNYKNEIHGKYTFFIGEVVEDFPSNIPSNLVALTIPAGKYKKFTTPSGEMPMVCINMWQKIWQMSPEELGGKRNFRIDFEVYDERASNPKSTILDIYVGVE